MRKLSRKTSGAGRLALSLMLLLPSLVFVPARVAAQRGARVEAAAPPVQETAPQVGGMSGQSGTYYPEQAPVKGFAPVNVSNVASQEALAPQEGTPAEIRPINPPQARPDWFEDRGHHATGGGDEISLDAADGGPAPQPPAASAQGSSPGPAKTFHGEYLNGSSIPPDTMGAVGPNHVVTVSNTHMNFRDRSGRLISRLTLNAFWAGVTLEGGSTTPSTFDPKVFYDRSADRFFLFTSANSLSPASSVLFATTQTGDPTGTWNRYVFDTDAASTATSGRWADYPTIGHNSQWIVANYNVFNYAGTPAATTGYFGPYIYVIPKSVAYANTPTLTGTSLFQASVSTCVSPFNNFLGCGFTMAPTVNEDNSAGTTTYLVEDWDAVFGQLRVSKITGPANAPVLTVGTQFPQSTENWRFNAARIGTTGGYLPQRLQDSYAPSTITRIMGNDSRINNSVLRNGSLWTSHHVMIGATPNPPGTAYGTGNPDIKTAAQWWQIDPTVEAQPDGVTGLGTPPVQRGRVFDPLADNCNSGSSSSNSTERAACTMRGQFFAYVGIAVNKDNDALIGFSQFSPLTYPSAAYAMRKAADPANTMRDVVVYRSGASNYNIGAGTANTTARQNRWGDYSASMTDPVDDTAFWTVQEYSETRTNFGIGIAAPWATWWAQVNPNSTQPTTTGNLIISEFRPRGPGGIQDEFVELYNQSATTPFRVKSVDNSEGWALATNNGVTTTPLTSIPEGVVIPPKGHYLIANSPVNNATGAESNYFSLTTYPGVSAAFGMATGGIRNSSADTGYSTPTLATEAIADNGGVAVFKSTTVAAFIPANQSDAAGFAGAGTTFREGTGIPAITPGAVTGQISFVRRLPGGCTNGTCTTPSQVETTPGSASDQPQDTDDNAADFVFTNTLATTETLGSTPVLGAPGPENVDGPLARSIPLNGTGEINVVRVDACVADTAEPNRKRDPAPITNGASGYLELRKRYTNTTAKIVTRLRLRVVDITTYPAAAGLADLRVLDSSNVVATLSALCGGGATVTIYGTTLEQPPTQPNGGGFNSTVSAGIVNLSQPLGPGQTVFLNVRFGVQQGGKFRAFIVVEALP